MLSNDEIIQRLVYHEGCVLKPYKCTEGFLTIGVGRNLETNPLTEHERKVCGDYMHGITKNAAFYLLRNDIDRVVEECAKAFPFWANLDNERQYALLDMVFCQGIAGVLKYKKMLGSMGVGNWNDASEHCLDSRWHTQAKKRCERIAELIRTGKWRV